MFKRSLSILLSLILTLTLFSSFSIEASAKKAEIEETGVKKLTLSQVKNWLDNELSYRNWSNPVGSGECVDFCNYYLTDCWGNSRIRGNAYTWKDKCPEGWKPINLNGTFHNCQIGDLIVEEYGSYGHVCIYYGYDNNDGYHYVVDQNNEYGRYVAKHRFWKPFSNPTYCFRPPVGDNLNFFPVDVGTDFYANIVCLSSGKVVTVSGSNVILGSKNGDNNQKWRFERQGDKSYKIINVATGDCLDVSNAASTNETNIQLCQSNDTNAQRWYFKYVGDGYSLVPKCAVNSCLDIRSGQMEDGTNIQLFEQNSSVAQIFGLNAQPSFSAINLGRNFTAYIVYNQSGSIVTVDSSGNTVVRPFDGSLIQRWNFQRMSDRAYKITNAETGKCLDVYGGNSDNKTNIWTHTSNDTNAQRWFIRFNGNGYSFVPKCAVNSAMDLDNGIADKNSNIHLYSYINEGPHQIFSIQYSLNAIEMKTYNGNTYAVYNYEIPWKEAYRYCEQQGGHLVTINSSEEQDFIHDLINNSNSRMYLWLGSSDVYNEGTWKWVTGDTLAYSNWADSEPNNNEDEDYMMMYKESGKWNDAHDSYYDFSDSYCFICEYENQTNIPDIIPEKSFEYNDHRYEFYSNGVDWHTAERYCKQKGGHLVTITSQEENSMIHNNIRNLSREEYWIGLSGIEREGVWRWVNDEAMVYSNWSQNQPDNYSRIEDYAEIYSSDGTWNDTAGFASTYQSIGFICEYDNAVLLGDTDGDGKVTIFDATAIQRHLADLPTNKYVEKAADADGDGDVTVLDATAIQRYLAGMSSNKMIGQPIT